MKTLTEDKLTIIGAAGMIGSNMAQSAILMGLTSNICMYDPYLPGLEGAAKELLHCGFKGVNITYTDSIEEALKGSRYIITSGGASRKQGMTREDLLNSNAAVAIQQGKDIRQYCPDVKHVIVIFNPADITGLLILLYSGLRPSQVSTLAALDSIRLRSELAGHFGINPDGIKNCRTYGGHGEQMAVFSSTATVGGRPLNDLIGTPALTPGQWHEIRKRVRHGGKTILELRGRGSFQSASVVSLQMLRAVMGGEAFEWPVGTYVSNADYDHIMMAWETTLNKDGVHCTDIHPTDSEREKLDQSYRHLCRMRDELIASGLIPSLADWDSLNPNL